MIRSNESGRDGDILEKAVGDEAEVLLRGRRKRVFMKGEIGDVGDERLPLVGINAHNLIMGHVN